MAIFDFVITTLDSVVMVRVSVDMILDSVVLILNVVAWIGNSRLLTQWIFLLDAHNSGICGFNAQLCGNNSMVMSLHS